MAIEKNFYNPYTFIPLNENIITYNEDEVKPLLDYSHDLPLSKAVVSGVVEFTMKAESPFCIKTDNDDSVNVDNKYFIPGTTIKGMIKNVFEIVTLSNIKNSIANSRYSMRDLRSPDYKLKSNEKEQRSGFLFQINHKFFIVGCENSTFLYEEIEEIEEVSISNEKSIKAKYLKLKDGYIFEDEEYDGYCMWFFSGFMNNKKHEFLFYIPKDFPNESKLYQINEEEYKDFIFIHEKENENENWKFWKSKLKNYSTLQQIIDDEYKGIIPCFFRIKQNESKWVVKDLGFSYLYRQPYDKSIHDCLPENLKQNNDIDMTQSVFGYSNSKSSLKGRISFSNSFLEDVETDDKQTFIMGKPKATYYPFYLKQGTKGVLNTYFHDKATIAGWKRNLIQPNAQKGTSSGKPKIETSFIPIKAGASFKCKLRFHNLKEYELGALLSAITFHNSMDCFHLLGYAKPLGYGKFSCTNIRLNVLFDNSVKIEYYISKFEDEIRTKTDFSSWNKTLSLLMKYARGCYEVNKTIRYPDLNSKEFEQIKNSKLRLSDFNPNF
jgi:CRISPR-associated protein (TIGR03986 family)